MVRWDFASIDGQAECAGADPEYMSSFRQIQPSLCFAPIPVVTRDLMMRAQRGHAFAGPPIPMPRQQAAPVERIGHQIIRTDVRQGAHRLHDLRSGVGAILTAPPPRQAQFGMHAAFPMNHEEDFTRLRVDVDDHLLDQGADYTFLQPHIRVRAVPRRLQVRRQMFKFLSCGCGTLLWSLEMLCDALLDLIDALQRLVPAPL